MSEAARQGRWSILVILTAPLGFVLLVTQLVRATYERSPVERLIETSLMFGLLSLGLLIATTRIPCR